MTLEIEKEKSEDLLNNYYREMKDIEESFKKRNERFFHNISDELSLSFVTKSYDSFDKKRFIKYLSNKNISETVSFFYENYYDSYLLIKDLSVTKYKKLIKEYFSQYSFLSNTKNKANRGFNNLLLINVYNTQHINQYGMNQIKQHSTVVAKYKSKYFENKFLYRSTLNFYALQEHVKTNVSNFSLVDSDYCDDWIITFNKLIEITEKIVSLKH